MNKLIAKRYAKALMELSSEAELKEQLNALNSLKEVFKESNSAEIVESPLIAKEEKFKLLVEPLKDKLDNKLYNLLKLMSEKGRLDLVSDLADILSFELQLKENSFEGIVRADNSLDKGDIERLEKILNRYSGANVKLKQGSKVEDGLFVSVEDLGIELSISKAKIKTELLDFIQKAL